MTLNELCEPLFQAVCRLNRSGRKGLSLDLHQVQAEIRSLLAELKAKSQTAPGVAEQYAKVELPLIFFVDSMISESGLNFARQWDSQRLAEELSPPELGGDEKFFDLLDETLGDRSPAAAERLQVFYTCLGLGFTGLYAGQPEYLRRKMNEIHARMKAVSESELTSRITPEAYENVNTADLVEPPGVKLVGWVIAMVGLLILVFITNFALFQTAKDDLDRSLDSVIASADRDGAGSNDAEKESGR